MAQVCSVSPMSASTGALARITEVAGLMERRRHLQARLLAAQEDCTVLDARAGEASAGLAQERADVAALEKMSFARIVSGLRGTRDTDLQREQAEAQAAEYVAAQAQARLAAARESMDAIAAELAGLAGLAGPGGIDEAWEQALAAREREVIASGEAAVADRLREVAARTGAATAEVRECDEALHAAHDAGRALQRASKAFASAESWANYDMAGGGFVADMAKHAELDKAQDLLRAADAALRRLAGELADVGHTPVSVDGIDDMTRAFDVYFDNIFSDYAVAKRIKEARATVERTLLAIDATIDALTRRRRSTDEEVGALAAERQRLLGA